MCFLPLKSSHYPSRPVPVPELFGKYPTRPVPKSKTPTRQTLLARHLFTLSSPRAESARAVTGRQCPHSGRGEDFLSRQPDFFTETAVTLELKVKMVSKVGN